MFCNNKVTHLFRFYLRGIRAGTELVSDSNFLFLQTFILFRICIICSIGNNLVRSFFAVVCWAGLRCITINLVDNLAFIFTVTSNCSGCFNCVKKLFEIICKYSIFSTVNILLSFNVKTSLMNQIVTFRHIWCEYFWVVVNIN